MNSQFTGLLRANWNEVLEKKRVRGSATPYPETLSATLLGLYRGNLNNWAVLSLGFPFPVRASEFNIFFPYLWRERGGGAFVMFLAGFPSSEREFLPHSTQLNYLDFHKHSTRVAN